jgi:hypothetical protein
MSEVFRDSEAPSLQLEGFADEVLVVCPKCGHQGVIRPTPGAMTASVHVWFRPHRLVCPTCSHVEDWQYSPRGHKERKGVVPGGPVDPWFRLHLWLSVDLSDGTLWAYNHRHLSYLESFVRAKLRLRAQSVGDYNQTMIEKLPAWTKSAKNRDEIVQAIARLRRRPPENRDPGWQ